MPLLFVPTLVLALTVSAFGEMIGFAMGPGNASRKLCDLNSIANVTCDAAAVKHRFFLRDLALYQHLNHEPQTSRKQLKNKEL